MAVDMKMLTELQSMGVKSAEFAYDGSLRGVEFFQPAGESHNYEFKLPDGTVVDQAMLDAIEEVSGEDRRAFEQKKREDLLFHSS